VPIISQLNHALFFDGVSDSVIIPQGLHSKLGADDVNNDRSASDIVSESSQGSRGASMIGNAIPQELAIEAWVTPDCGGIVVSKHGQFSLSIGNVDTPGPAVFRVNTHTKNGFKPVILQTATVASNRYNGTVYPSVTHDGIDDSFNRFEAAKDDATGMNINQRPLIHLVGAITKGQARLYVNGVLMAKENLDTPIVLNQSDEHVYIGGKGGEFRGTIESVHISRAFDVEMLNRNAPLVNDDTLCLFRFEEPVIPYTGSYTISSIGASSSNLSNITISTTEAAALATALKGTSVTSGTVDFTISPFSSGDYTVVDYKTSPGTRREHLVPHVPFNLLINPGSINRATMKPNQSPPERVRLHSINVGTGVLEVSSIHLDLENSTHDSRDNASLHDGLRGVLHSRAAATGDNYFVVIPSDLLIENGAGRPYQPPHLASQIIDRTGQMLLDEGNFEQHGLAYSSRMATTTSDTNNPFAVTWPTSVDEAFQIGHSGRHTYNHVEGHHYLRMMPKANDEILDQQVGNADILTLSYENAPKGIDKQLPINSKVDYYRDVSQHVISSITNESVAYEMVDNGLSGASREIIGLGGASGTSIFNAFPFVLKGPVPLSKNDIDDTVRNFHLRPSKQSRVAILTIPSLSTHNLAPFVEVHYNAIDFTGVSMGKTNPMLMVEKTIPAASVQTAGSSFTDATCDYNNDPTVTMDDTANIRVGMRVSGTGIPAGAYIVSITNSTTFELSAATTGGSVTNGTLTFTPAYIADIVAADLVNTAVTCTVCAPGGIIDIQLPFEGSVGQKAFTHSLIGDNSEGYESDSEIDERYTPENYSTMSDEGRKTPQNISASHTSKSTHESVFHKLLLEAPPPSSEIFTSRRSPYTDIGSPGDGEFDVGITASASPVHELFDIIDNHAMFTAPGTSMRLFVQPSDRKRTRQLVYARDNFHRNDQANIVTIMHLMTRALLRSIEEQDADGESRYTAITCVGLNSLASSVSVSEIGSGSPDSHTVKEIDPNAPVVTVSLGGPGQGAYDTKPSFDPSPLSRLPYSTRRGFSIMGESIRVSPGETQYIQVRPLNNSTPDLQSWGTYPFPKKGRLFLKNGASAEYSSKSGVSFMFTDGTAGDGKFTLADGQDLGTFKAWCIASGLAPEVVDIGNSFTDATCDTDTTATSGAGTAFGDNPKLIQMDSTASLKIGMTVSGSGITAGSIITNITSSTLFLISNNVTATATNETLTFTYVGDDFSLGEVLLGDGHFYIENAAADGTTVNDRMFQSMDTATHDYQLGTQFASTRALVEIPLFGGQFFENSFEGIYPGPDNSLKLHIDATMTAHSWNPSPVGRRFPEKAPADRAAKSAYAYAIERFESTKRTSILRRAEISGGKYHLYVNNEDAFPAAVTSASSYHNVDNVLLYRQAFLPNGEWILYENDPASDGYLQFEDEDWAYSEGFLSSHEVGMALLITDGYESERVIPIFSDDETTSSDFEGRSEYYYDQASTKTQGGNVDYGLRQYVSAVEFKAGPTANPHAPRVETKRASATIKGITPLYNQTNFSGIFTVTLSEEEAALFPSIEPNVDGSNNVRFQSGDMHYIVQITLPDGTFKECIYWGDSSVNFTHPSLVMYGSGTVTTPTIPKSTIILETIDSRPSLPNFLTPTHSSYILGQNLILQKRTLSAFSSEITSTNLRNNINLSQSYRPSANSESWTISNKVSVTELRVSPPSSGMYMTLQHSDAPWSGKFSVKVGDSIYAEAGTAAGPGNMLQAGAAIYLGTVTSVTEGHKAGAAYSTVTLTDISATSGLTGTVEDDLDAIMSAGTVYLRVGLNSIMPNDDEAILNRTWLHPYAQGGLREGDTIWANMTYNNPHATEGLFAKSRGVLNEAMVSTVFNSGEGTLNNNPRSSIPLENFLIGNSCYETALNYVQHVNKTIELNYTNLGLSNPPTVAYLDPYLSHEDHARVLLFDVAHDREFIAFQDLHMQVQSSAMHAHIGWNRDILGSDLAWYTANSGGTHNQYTTQIDVPAGFPSENRFVVSTSRSRFMESAYAHNRANYLSSKLINPVDGSSASTTIPSASETVNTLEYAWFYGKGIPHYIQTGFEQGVGLGEIALGDSVLPRTQEAVVSPYYANKKHPYTRKGRTSEHNLTVALRQHRANTSSASIRDPSTLFDTPDGTRVIPAYLALKGIRSSSLDLSGHSETRLQHLKQWTDMDFTRRLSIDLGEVGVRDGVTDVEAAAREVVRLINQGAAPNGRTHIRRPNEQYAGEIVRDDSAPHINADFSATGSTYNPAAWWDDSNSEKTDKGTHMGYVRAHLGRVVQDSRGREGYSIIIHSTIPGATGRNFCVWLDNSRGQTAYEPEFLIGHGGRYRTFWCVPDEMSGENMHPAPMPLNKHGRPFAPITSLKQYTIPDDTGQQVNPNDEFGEAGKSSDETSDPVNRAISTFIGAGKTHNTINTESLEAEGFVTSLVSGLRTGTSATGRVNFGGLVASGIPGFAPDTGEWGFGRKGDKRITNYYGDVNVTDNAITVASCTTTANSTQVTFSAVTAAHAIVKGMAVSGSGIPSGTKVSSITNSTTFQLDKDATAGASVTLTFTPSAPTGYTTHVPTNDVLNENIGSSNLYGFRFVDHRGIGHGIRFVYRQFGQKFALENTELPDSINEEIMVYIDDRDVGQGGFTIGRHMHGSGDATGRFPASDNNFTHVPWRGNRWRGVPSPSAAFDCEVTYDASANTLTIQPQAPYNTCPHHDMLGYMGFPLKNGVIQVSDPFYESPYQGSQGHMYSYTSRTRDTGSGTHVFYGVTGADFVASHKTHSGNTIQPPGALFGAGGVNEIRALISSCANWTTLVTDELMAAITTAVINMSDVNSEDGLTFDCTDMYAADGRTFGEWGVSPEAIRVRAFDPSRNIQPLSNFFEATLHKDLAIQAAHVEYGEIASLSVKSDGITLPGTSRATTDAKIDAGLRNPCGYIPHTLIQVRTKGKGSNANTLSPILVDSKNNPINTHDWKKNLIGENYTADSGDHILPSIDNPTVLITAADVAGANHLDIATGEMWYFSRPAGGEGDEVNDNGATARTKVASFGNISTIYYREQRALVTGENDSSNAQTKFTLLETSSDWPTGDPSSNAVMQRYGKTSGYGITGKRSLGSVNSVPQVFFRGARDSSDHSVPLFFGGGFSGVVLDINDGTDTDYSSFNTHPYANGPTGCAGIQHANEVLSSHAMIDCNAIMAFFPGTPLLNQHRGSITPPFSNQDNVLSPDIKRGTQTVTANHPNSAPYTAGVHIQVPSPYILRFAHPTARYGDATAGTENKTSYLIFGPGQAFPFTQEVADSSASHNAKEPHPGRAITTGGSWSSVPYGKTAITDATCDTDHSAGSGSSFGSNPKIIQMDNTTNVKVGMTVTGTGIADNSIVTQIDSSTLFRVSEDTTATNTNQTLTFTLNQTFPNHIENEQGHYMPMTSAYQVARGRFHWRQTLNWEPPIGKPNTGVLYQRPEQGRMYGDMVNPEGPTPTATNISDFRVLHPTRHAMFMGGGMISNSDWTWHMDGGYHPGGSWMDNQISMNPAHPNGNTLVAKEAVSACAVHPTAFRVAGAMAKRVLFGSSGAFQVHTPDTDDVDMEYIVVDGTRCQNGEELATIIGAAINTFPGAGALKAMGGTFMPSMGNALRQDRYGWKAHTVTAYRNDGSGVSGSAVDTTADLDRQISAMSYLDVSVGSDSLGEQVPASGWLRTGTQHKVTVASSKENAAPAYAPYHTRIVYASGGDYYIRFYLGYNYLTGNKAFENVETWHDIETAGSGDTFTNIIGTNDVNLPTIAADDIVYVWTKAGTFSYNNENASSRNHMTNVHFSGLVDAIDRTKPTGVVGWAGERYSYLNSLGVTPTGGSKSYAAGLGAWHPMLGFSPYGSSNSCMTTLSHLPHSAPMPNSAESIRPDESYVNYPVSGDAPYDTFGDMDTEVRNSEYGTYKPGYADVSDFNSTPTYYNQEDITSELHNVQGVYSRAFLVIAYESELPLVAKYDRDGITCTGDWLLAEQQGNKAKAGTTRWDERIHGQDRFVCTANAGPNVEALIASTTSLPTISNITATNGLDAAPFDAEFFLHDEVIADNYLENATPCRAETGDLFYDLDKSIGSHFSASAGAQRNVGADFYANPTNRPSAYFKNSATGKSFWVGDVNGYEVYKRSAAKNFNVENAVWKRMDGGSLSLPTVNARGLGAIPWINRVKSNTQYTMGEKLYGNVRFSFETTNSAMMPILQAQELSHPQLAARHPHELRNILEIPNEELQFEAMNVVDDTGQTHSIEGGSPFGVIIRAFQTVGERLASGLQPANANSNIEPNLKVQLPNPDAIPGNIIVRSGFDRLQAYQNENIGDGGMLHPDLGASHVGHLFDNAIKGPRFGPTMGEVGWEHISQSSSFPDSTRTGWKGATEDNPIQSSYELHDRTLFFHVTKMGHSHTERYPVTYNHTSGVVNQSLTVSSFSGTTLTASATITSAVFDADFATKEKSDNRRFLRLATATDAVVVSYTGISGATFTGVIGDIDFDQFLIDNPPATSTINITPSYYVPAGSTRFFAARRLRDHAEVSGNSPDMAHTLYFDGDQDTLLHTRYSKPQLTPMPYPRMGHHFVNATMPMLPGHWAHPAYQGLYDRSRAEQRVSRIDEDYITLQDNIGLVDTSLSSTITDKLHPLNPPLRVSSLTANPSGPSDIHGGAFTLMFETKVKYDGYGILASKGTAGDMNKAGGHSIILEAAGNYTLDNHFPDPAEVGAYQIVIQPNVRKQQIAGFHRNNATTTGLPTAGTAATELTGQQVNLVVGIKYDSERGTAIGGVTLILAEATLADVRGCEVFINEVILDHDPDHGGQFTNIPSLLTYNALGVQGNQSPPFTRSTHAYHVGMFDDSTPGRTLHIPWWSIMHKVGPDDSTSTGFRHLSLYRVDNYYEFCRASFGSIGCQLTLAGYPSIYPDMYSKVLANASLSPAITVQSTSFTNATCDYNNDPTITHDDDDGQIKAGMLVTGTGIPAGAYVASVTSDTEFELSASTTGGAVTNGTLTFYGIVVDDASFLPEVPYYGQKLQYTATDGTTKEFDYTIRSGTTNNATTMNKPNLIVVPTTTTMPQNGAVLRLTREYSTASASTLFNNGKTSVLTRSMPQMLAGTRDTNSLHTPDAFLSMWHPNLGRPHTFYSDGSRTWGNLTSDRAVNKAAYNSMPEHFETIHYHGANYAISHGPFNLDMKTPKPPTRISAVIASVSSTYLTFSGNIASEMPANTLLFTSDGLFIGKVSGSLHFSGTTTTAFTTNLINTPSTGIYVYKDADGSVETAANIHAMSGYEAQGSNTVMLSHYWPCGSRGGALNSRLDGYAAWSAGWHVPRAYTAAGATYWTDADDDGSYAVSNGISTAASSSIVTRTYPFGYRFGLRQPWNRPQWGHYGMRAYQEAATHASASNFTVGYKAGPLTEYETESWNYAGGAGLANSTLPVTYVGIMERQTNASAMLGVDKPEWQVRYSDGRRMTRSYGCPVRTIRNTNTVATATITVTDGDAASGMTEKQTINLISTDGTSRTYVLVDDNATTVATGDVLTSTSDTGASTAGSALAGGIAVAINLTGSASTQNAYLVQLKAAIEHANGHNGKITVSAVPGEANGNQAITVTQVKTGLAGNTPITENLDNVTVTAFTGAEAYPRDWWGDNEALGITTIDSAVGYYLVDWWGNTRGEDVRRTPVRGFGIRPAWDAGDAYEYDRTNNRTPHARIWNNGKPIFNTKGVLDSSGNLLASPAFSIPRFGGSKNNTNNNDSNSLVDVFAPTNAMRVGDMGGGRGVRYPTQFNEDLLVELSAVYESSGVVLSHHTSEPAFGQGYIRPRNDVLQSDEVKRGISTRLDIDEDGLLKPEAVVSDRVEEISGTSVHKDAISRTSPRIGIDAQTIESLNGEINRDMVAINTEAHSLHTDRGVGQRVVLHGGMQAGSQTLGDYDLTGLTFTGQPQGGVMRFSHTANIKPLGGSYIIESRSFVNPFDDTGWGRSNLAGGLKTSNPYQTTTYNSTSAQTNYKDKTVRFMLRPVRLLDNQHIEIFRPELNLHTNSPQDGGTFFAATAGGKYGLFNYEASNARASDGFFIGGSSNPSSNAPYQPVYLMETNPFTDATCDTNHTAGSGSSFGSNPKIIQIDSTAILRVGMGVSGTGIASGSVITQIDSATLFRVDLDTTATNNNQTLTFTNDNAPMATGPKLPGTEATGFDKTSLKSTVTRLIISENSLQHFRADAARNTGVDKDYTVKPRFSQSLHSKGHKEDVTYNTSDHSGDAS